jgi:hypothetical protein
MGEVDDRDTVGQPWVSIPRSNVTVGVVRELLGVMADVALSTVPEPSCRPYDDARAAMQAGWEAAIKRLDAKERESEVPVFTHVPPSVIELADKLAAKSGEPVVRAWLDWKLEQLDLDLDLEKSLGGDPDRLVTEVMGGITRIIGRIDDPAAHAEFVAYCEERVE